MKKQRYRSRKSRITVVRSRCADHATVVYPKKLALTSPTSGSRSVDVVHLRAKDNGVCFYAKSPPPRYECIQVRLDKTAEFRRYKKETDNLLPPTCQDMKF
jgi:hypothetical protein